MSDPTDPVSTPATSEPEKMIPLSAVLPLLGWSRLQLQGYAEAHRSHLSVGENQGPAPAFIAAYDLAATAAGMKTSHDLFLRGHMDFLRDAAYRNDTDQPF